MGLERAWRAQEALAAAAPVWGRLFALAGSSLGVWWVARAHWVELCDIWWQYPAIQGPVVSLSAVAVYMSGVAFGKWYWSRKP